MNLITILLFIHKALCGICFRGLEAPDQPFAAQLVGFSAASKATKYCIDSVRLHVVKGPVVSFERFIVEPIESK